MRCWHNNGQWLSISAESDYSAQYNSTVQGRFPASGKKTGAFDFKIIGVHGFMTCFSTVQYSRMLVSIPSRPGRRSLCGSKSNAVGFCCRERRLPAAGGVSACTTWSMSRKQRNRLVHMVIGNSAKQQVQFYWMWSLVPCCRVALTGDMSMRAVVAAAHRLTGNLPETLVAIAAGAPVPLDAPAASYSGRISGACGSSRFRIGNSIKWQVRGLAHMTEGCLCACQGPGPVARFPHQEPRRHLLLGSCLMPLQWPRGSPHLPPTSPRRCPFLSRSRWWSTRTAVRRRSGLKSSTVLRKRRGSACLWGCHCGNAHLLSCAQSPRPFPRAREVSIACSGSLPLCLARTHLPAVA